MVSLRGTGTNLRPTEPFSEWPWWVRKGVRDPSAEAGVTTEPWNRMEKKKRDSGQQPTRARVERGRCQGVPRSITMSKKGTTNSLSKYLCLWG